MPGCSLNIREPFRARGPQKLEPLAACKHEPQIAKQLLVVGLADAEEVHDLSIEVIEDFDGQGLFMKQNPRSARECFHIRLVLRKYFADLLGEAVSPSYIRKRSDHD